MTQVTVSASITYKAVIGSGLIKKLGSMTADIISHCKAAVITDDIVDSLYGKDAVLSLENAGFSVCKFVFKNGESSKNLEVYCKVLEFLARNKLSRSDIIVALGGGVVGDLSGYAAATYLRGIKFIQVPTTFLAAIDSSVGGKTAVNLSAGKNLAGAFHQPALVVCDIDTMKTLSEDIFADGTAEAIKYGVLADKELFEEIASGNFYNNLESVIAKCIGIKADIVGRDELDLGERQLLNLGHTIGHAIEKCSNMQITHGHAVAIGMLMIAKSAFKLGLSEENCALPIETALKNNNLPLTCNFSAESLAQAAFSDKKRSGKYINFIIPKTIGHCEITKVSSDDILKIISAGL